MHQPEQAIAVIGLGYVGLPLVHAFGKAFPRVIGFDISAARIAELRRGHDKTGEVSAEELRASSVLFTSDPAELRAATALVVTVPTPIDANRRPDLRPVLSACDTVGAAMAGTAGRLVVFESTVYPGLTESICVPRLEAASGLRWPDGFSVGYSPERINPGDREHRLERITKVVSGDTPQTLDRVAALYAPIIQAGVHRAPSIAVAEAAKVIENTQRDLNIALMNELSMIFDRLGLRTADVLAAARTKWNFMPFTPGLVGGHCIGVDPYYLTARAEQVGYQPHVILSGRRVNDGMGAYVADRLVQLMLRDCGFGRTPQVGVLGITFKENVPDIRNSRVPDIIARLAVYGVACRVHDPLADRVETEAEYGITLVEDLDELRDLDALVLAVPHADYLSRPLEQWTDRLRDTAVLVDVKSVLDCAAVRAGITYWSL
jgi:UDP-N-acetyl-D-glucosamine/UDP-N-acetyl-D-galactosamine dehydrogenase